MSSGNRNHPGAGVRAPPSSASAKGAKGAKSKGAKGTKGASGDGIDPKLASYVRDTVKEVVDERMEKQTSSLMVQMADLFDAKMSGGQSTSGTRGPKPDASKKSSKKKGKKAASLEEEEEEEEEDVDWQSAYEGEDDDEEEEEEEEVEPDEAGRRTFGEYYVARTHPDEQRPIRGKGVVPGRGGRPRPATGSAAGSSRDGVGESPPRLMKLPMVLQRATLGSDLCCELAVENSGDFSTQHRRSTASVAGIEFVPYEGR